MAYTKKAVEATIERAITLGMIEKKRSGKIDLSTKFTIRFGINLADLIKDGEKNGEGNETDQVYSDSGLCVTILEYLGGRGTKKEVNDFFAVTSLMIPKEINEKISQWRTRARAGDF